MTVLGDAFCVIFRAPPAMPELSASFSSSRVLTVVSARGLLRVCQLVTTVLWIYTHSYILQNNNTMLRHERQTVEMALAESLHHSAQRPEKASAREVEEQDQHEALRRQKAPPPGMRPGVLQDPAPQGRVGQHSGIGYELVLALDVPVLQMVEQPVDASALAFFEEEEAKALNAEYLMLARSATSHTVRLREVIQRMHVLRQKKRRKKKLPKASSSRSSCASHAARTRISGRSSTCPLYLAVLFGVMVLPEEYFGAFPYSAIPWFYYGYSTCVSRWCFWLLFHIFLCEGGPRLQRSFLAATCPDGLVGMTRRTVTWREFGSVMCKACFAGFYTSRCILPVVLKPMMPCIMAGMDQRDSYLVRVWRWHVQCLFCWCFCTSRCIPPAVLKPMMPRIMAGMDQRDSYLVRVWQWHVQCCPRAVFPSLSSGPRCPSSWPACTQVQFLDKVFYMPVVVLRVVPRSRQCSALFGGSAVTVHHGHLIPVVAQKASPWLRLFSRPLRFHCCCFDVSVVQDRQVRLVQAWRRQPCPTLPWRTRLRSHSCSSSTLVYVLDWQVPQVQSWKRQLYSHSFGLLVLGLGVQASRFHRCSLRGDSRYPTVAASRRICSTLTRWLMSRLWFACLLLLNNRCRHSR